MVVQKGGVGWPSRPVVCHLVKLRSQQSSLQLAGQLVVFIRRQGGSMVPGFLKLLSHTDHRKFGFGSVRIY